MGKFVGTNVVGTNVGTKCRYKMQVQMYLLQMQQVQMQQVQMGKFVQVGSYFTSVKAYEDYTQLAQLNTAETAADCVVP